MLPNFLLEEQVVEKDGEGPVLDLGASVAKPLILTLGITEAKEQQSLDIQIFGSVDGADFGPKPLTLFPQKFYKGISAITLDLTPTPGVRYLRVKWKTNRWGHWTDGALFRCYVFAELADV